MTARSGLTGESGADTRAAPADPKRRRRVFLGVAFVLAMLLIDVSKPPERQYTAKAEVAAIDWYKAHLADRQPAHCLFIPTCSQYAKLAILKYGAVKGTAKAVWRIVRCSPFTTKRGEDWP